MYTRKLALITTPIVLLILSLMTACQAAAPPAIPGGVVNPVDESPQAEIDTAELPPEPQESMDTEAPSVQNTEAKDDSAGSSPELQQFAQGDDTGTQDDDDDESLLESMEHPIANALVEEFDVSYEEIVALHQAGYGFGQIVKAFSLADELGMTPQEILPQANEMGWGELLKAHGLHPSLAGKGNNLGAIMSEQKDNGNHPAHAGPPGGDGPPGQTKKGK